MAGHLVLRSCRYLPILEGHNVLNDQADELEILLTIHAKIELLSKALKMKVLEASFKQPVAQQKMRHQLDTFFRV